MMKSQDVFLLLKLISLEKSRLSQEVGDHSLRQLGLLTGISNAELSKALNHCIDVGLVARDRHTQRSLVSRKALLGFLLQGIKYVFPVRPAVLVRGMSTTFSADYF